MFTVAHASDGGGSIRVPSSCCGTVGLKPSRGRIPTRVTAWEASSTDGVITTNVADTAAILDVISIPNPNLYYPSAPAPAQPFSLAPSATGPRLRIGLLLDAPTGLPVDDECVAAALKAAEILRQLGHSVSVANPTFYSREAIEGFLEVVINGSIHIYPFEDPTLAEPYIQRRRSRALDFHAGDYAIAAARLHAETPNVRAQWGRDFDLLLTPTMATQTPRVGEVIAEANTNWDGGRETEIRMISFTAVSNISGLPAISLPVHTSTTGMPIGVQLVGGPFGEWELLRVAAEIEQACAWSATQPAIHA
jgi:amidase